jgi:hypothetical protein
LLQVCWFLLIVTVYFNQNQMELSIQKWSRIREW